MGRLSHVAESVMVGDHFGRWTITGPHRRIGDGAAVFPVECECGTKKDIRLKYLRNGQSKSCGCLQRETAAKRLTTHGRSGDKRFSWLWKTYGLTTEDWDRMFLEQRGLCKICVEPLEDPWIRVDHDHSTGKVRGLLCHGCNVGIGHLKEDVEVLKRAIAYLEGSI